MQCKLYNESFKLTFKFEMGLWPCLLPCPFLIFGRLICLSIYLSIYQIICLAFTQIICQGLNQIICQELAQIIGQELTHIICQDWTQGGGPNAVL